MAHICIYIYVCIHIYLYVCLCVFGTINTGHLALQVGSMIDCSLDRMCLYFMKRHGTRGSGSCGLGSKFLLGIVQGLQQTPKSWNMDVG